MLKIIKKSLFVFFIFVAQTVSANEPIDKNLVLGTKILTVKDWLLSLREKGYKIFFVYSQIDADRLIRLNHEEGDIKSLLKDILRGQPLDIVEKEDRIFIVRHKVVPLDPDLIREKKILNGPQYVFLFNPNAPF